MNMELCSVCSQLDPFLRHWEERILGPYDELLLKSHSLGSSLAGCGGCAFFCMVIQNSDRWSGRIPELSNQTLVRTSWGLVARPSSGSSGIPEHYDSYIGICNQDGRLKRLKFNEHDAAAQLPTTNEHLKRML
jgi:hypothetical protein